MSANGDTAASSAATGQDRAPHTFVDEEEAKAREETKLIVLESISDTLETAWPQDESHRKKTVKQLLLKWHPDKNTEEDEELATAATQHIHAEVERLEQGLPRGGGVGFQAGGGTTFDPRNPFAGSPTFQRYFEEAYKQHHEQMNRRRREQQQEKERRKRTFAPRSNLFNRDRNPFSKTDDSKSYSNANGGTSGSADGTSGSTSGFTSGTSSPSNGASNEPRSRASAANGHFEYTPHPPSSSYSSQTDSQTKVLMMLMQAREDLRSADNDYEAVNPAYEWACFKSHQAAEKALKAVHLSKNNTKSFSHDLTSLAALAKDEELKRTSKKLQDIVGDNNKLYNLVFVDFDTIPHVQFTRELACDAIMCAKDILQRAQEIEGIADI